MPGSRTAGELSAGESAAGDLSAGESAAVESAAVESALGALSRRDLSAAELEWKLAAKGFSDAERENALATLRRTGLVDDGRFASVRAETLAARGSGDELIRHDLERAGVASETIEAAVAELEPERDRAQRIVERRGEGPKTLRYLAGKGFSADALDSLGGHSSGSGRGDCW